MPEDKTNFWQRWFDASRLGYHGYGANTTRTLQNDDMEEENHSILVEQVTSKPTLAAGKRTRTSMNATPGFINSAVLSESSDEGVVPVSVHSRKLMRFFYCVVCSIETTTHRNVRRYH